MKAVAFPTASAALWIAALKLLGASVEYPGTPPGPARLVVAGSDIVLSNRVLAAGWRLDSTGLRRAFLRDTVTGRALAFSGAAFEVVLADGRRLTGTDLRRTGEPVVTALVPEPAAARLAARIPGRQVEVPWQSADGALHLVWRVIAGDDSSYFREELDLLPPAGDLTIREIRWLDEPLPGVRRVGRVDGSPLVVEPFFLGYEDPMASNQVGETLRPVGTWAPDDVALGSPRRKSWPVDPAALVEGVNAFVFRYERGPHRLDIARAALVENGRELARDEHSSWAGVEHVENEYRLTLARVNRSARYELVADLGTDPALRLPRGQRVESYGRVVLSIADGRASCRLVRQATLRRGERLSQSFVLGVAPAGQLRRGFLHYLERERAHPYRPFLHYNSWYDIAWHPFALNQTNCLDAIRITGDRFIRPHRIVMDALVFDDGWDDPRTLWQFHAGFPNGFTPLADLCRQYETRLGVWLSPFGGYGEPREQRLKFGRAQGFETNATGFSLAGPKYYAAFKQACIDMIRRYGVNHFKFDGIASGMYASGSGADYILDTEAMRRLMLELRAEDPNLYINLTTGSWPSPFWLRYADSLWRQGGDMGHAGKGGKQQQWLTYRDQEVYRNIVRKGPLFPLSSLMTQGVAYSRDGSAGDPTFDSAGFKDDVRAFFGAGTSLQELYIQPNKLTAADWTVLAEAARWSRTNAHVLQDTHWLGGNPARLEVYGYASWFPGNTAARSGPADGPQPAVAGAHQQTKGIVMLRNPDDRPQEFALDIGTAFELLAGAPRRFRLTRPWAEDRDLPALSAEAGSPLRLALRPFEVLVLDAIPSADR
jgi:hypothetical protein